MILVKRLTQTGQGPEQALRNKHQDTINPHRQLTRQRQHAAKKERARKAQQNQNPNERNKRRTEGNRPPITLTVGVTFRPYPLQLIAFGGKAFDCGDPAEVIGQTRI